MTEPGPEAVATKLVTSRRLNMAWLLIPGIAVLFLDLATKAWFFRGGLAAARARYIDTEFIEIHVNTGVAWSMFADYPVFVVAITLALIPLLTWVYWTYFRGQSVWIDAAFGSILGGALGNGYDRLAGMFPSWGVGGVRDFISVDLGFWPANPWPTFNIADAGITVGFVILLLMQRSPQPDQAAD